MDNQLIAQKHKTNIRLNYFNKYYYKCIESCKAYFKNVKHDRKKFGLDIRDDLYLINLYIGLSYKKINKLKLSKQYIQKSIKYSLNDTQLHVAIKQLAELYAQWHMIDKAIHSYKQSLHYYRKIKDTKSRANVLFNIAVIKNRPNHMQKIIFALERLDNIEKYYELIIQQYVDLLQYLFKHKKDNEAIGLLDGITNLNVKAQVCQQLYQQIA